MLSVVVVTVGDTVEPRHDTADLVGTLVALARQIDPPPMEIVVPYHERIVGIEALKRQFDAVRFVDASPLKTFIVPGCSREHHDEIRARGALAARGEIVAFLEDHVRPDPHWSRRIVEAHRRECANMAGVGGAVENGVDRALCWAAYFCDLGKYQNPVGNGESPFMSLVNGSYKRQALERIRPVWRERFNETVVNAALRVQDERLALRQDIVTCQVRPHLRFGIAAREFVIWGRSYGRTRGRLIAAHQRLAYTLVAPLLPGLLIPRLAANVLRRRRLRGAFVRALPFIFVLTACWSWGEFLGYLDAPTRP